MSKKYHYIYKITELSTDFIYIGVRSSSKPPESDVKYMGSGTIIKPLVDENPDGYVKEILSEHASREEAEAEEARLVTPEFIMEKTNYNQVPGGRLNLAEIKKWTTATRTGEWPKDWNGVKIDKSVRYSWKDGLCLDDKLIPCTEQTIGFDDVFELPAPQMNFVLLVDSVFELTWPCTLHINRREMWVSTSDFYVHNQLGTKNAITHE